MELKIITTTKAFTSRKVNITSFILHTHASGWLSTLTMRMNIIKKKSNRIYPELHERWWYDVLNTQSVRRYKGWLQSARIYTCHDLSGHYTLYSVHLYIDNSMNFLFIALQLCIESFECHLNEKQRNQQRRGQRGHN